MDSGRPSSSPDRYHGFVQAPPRRRLATGIAVGLAVLGMTAIGVVFARQPAPDWVGGSIGPVAPRSPGVPASSAAGAPSTEPVVLPESAPVALVIPAIGVQSRLLHVGQGADGGVAMPPPGPRYDDAAWYRHSPAPGSLGPAILVGHVDSAAQGPSVFFNLGDLRPGDRVLVSRADGSSAAFTVDGVRRFRKDRFPTALIYGDTDHAALRLITCGGPFDTASGHYTDNIVVFASLDASGAG